MKIFRVVVRGEFNHLTNDARAKLLAEQAQHDLFASSFTADGCFSYDDRLVAFNFRYEVRDSEDLGDEAVGGVILERTANTLAGMGLAHKRLRATTTDMASIWE